MDMEKLDMRKLFSAMNKVQALTGETKEEFMASRFVAKTVCDGLVFSTARIVDGEDGWNFETAIADANSIIPVERYRTEEEAMVGHVRWVQRAPNLKTVIRLSIGWAEPLVGPEEYTLVRVDKK